MLHTPSSNTCEDEGLKKELVALDGFVVSAIKSELSLLEVVVVTASLANELS